VGMASLTLISPPMQAHGQQGCVGERGHRT
jgi:hypothetical protein